MSVAEKIKQEIIQPQKNNNGLLVGNPVYKPFRYPWVSKWFINRITY